MDNLIEIQTIKYIDNGINKIFNNNDNDKLFKSNFIIQYILDNDNEYKNNSKCYKYAEEYISKTNNKIYPGYNYLYELFYIWINKIINCININTKNLEYISISLHNNQLLMLNTIVNVILQLLLDDNIISKYDIELKNKNKLCNIIKKIYIMNIIDSNKISLIGSVINPLIVFLDDIMIIKTNIISDKSELDKISVSLLEKYNDLYNKYNNNNNNNENIYLTHKLYIKYNINEKLLKNIVDKIQFLKQLAYINNNIKSKYILEYLYIIIKYQINIIYNIKIIDKDKNNEYRKNIYLMYEYLQILVSYLFSSNNDVSDEVKNSILYIFNNILIPHKHKINNIWKYNNNKLFEKLKIFKNKFNDNDITNNILFDIDINSDKIKDNIIKSPTFIAINLNKHKHKHNHK